jgi:hypothetical protein
MQAVTPKPHFHTAGNEDEDSLDLSSTVLPSLCTSHTENLLTNENAKDNSRSNVIG